jgi:RNA polymerase sigma-70 factor, ECF subfamily
VSELPTVDIDERVRACCSAGDYTEAATLILRHLGPRVLGAVHARFRDEEQSAEVFSRFAESLWRGLPGFEFRTALRVWVFMLARNAGSRYLNRELRRQRLAVPLTGLPDAVLGALAYTRTQTLPHLRTASHTRLDAFRATLADDDQQLLSLRLGEALEYVEIAQVLLGEAAPEDAVAREAARLRKRMQLIKARIRDALRTSTDSDG